MSNVKKLVPGSNSDTDQEQWIPIFASVGCVIAFVLFIALIEQGSMFWKWLKDNSSELTALAAILGSFGLGIAAIAALLVRNQVELQRETAQRQSSRECLWRFTDQWRDQMLLKGSDGKHRWSRALEALGSASWKHAVTPASFMGDKDQDVVEVLNFFEGVAFMWSRGDMDIELSWNDFSDTGLTLHERSRDFVDAYRRGWIKRQPEDDTPGADDQSFWENFDIWVKALKEYDESRSRLREARAKP